MAMEDCGHDHSGEAARMWEVFKRFQEQILARGATSPDMLSWAETLINIASGLIISNPTMLRKTLSSEDGMDRFEKAMSTLYHPDTVRELIRLALILEAQGPEFNDKQTIQPNEATDSVAPVEGDIMGADELRRLMGGLDAHD